MKPTYKILFGFVAASAWLIAGSVTIPNAFTANTTAKASEVNENFSAVKTAVDGNAGDIATNKSGIATNKTNITTNANNMITGVNAANGLAGGGNSGSVTVRRADGYVSVHPSAFMVYKHDSNDCILHVDHFLFAFRPSTDSDCEAVAHITLPDHAKITSFSCKVQKVAATGGTILLHKVDETAPSTVAQLLIPSVTGTYSLSTPTINDDPVVDNSTYSYYITLDPNDDTSGASANHTRLYTCRVGYTYDY